MRAAWLLLGVGLLVASGYVWWYSLAEHAAHAPPTFVNLVRLVGSLCGLGGPIPLGQAFGKIKPQKHEMNPRLRGGRHVFVKGRITRKYKATGRSL